MRGIILPQQPCTQPQQQKRASHSERARTTERTPRPGRSTEHLRKLHPAKHRGEQHHAEWAPHGECSAPCER
eukprot:5328980-Alexandrium_andersonii.AAC.1